MKARLGAGACALVLASCGGDGVEPLRIASDGAFSCEPTSVQVFFDPASGVLVEARGRDLATATFTERRVSKECKPLPDARRRSLDEGDLLGAAIYESAELECATAAGARIDVHPIFDADLGRDDGSTLLVVAGRTVVFSAVLKNNGDPRASRIYYAHRSCTPGPLR